MSPGAHKLYEEASPITYVSRDDPPVWLFYSEADRDLPPDARAGQGIHHPRFGKLLKEKLDPLGIECTVRHATDYKEQPMVQVGREIVAFFKKHFGLK